jgi:hypothetical protein
MSVRRLFTATAAVAATLALAPLVATSASASEVTNDRIAGAVAIQGPLPTTTTQDTTAADITDADDMYFADNCGMSFAIERTVWFRYTDEDGAGFGLNPEASDYDSSVAIFEGDPRDGGTVVACGEEEVAAKGDAGQQYYIAVYADRPGSTGGTLSLTVRPLLAPPTTPVFTIDPTVTIQDGRTALVSGTYACTNTHESESSRYLFGSVGFDAIQAKPRSYFYVTGLDCDGAVHDWQGTAQTWERVSFSGGRGTASAYLVAAGDLASSINEVSQTILGVRAR